MALSGTLLLVPALLLAHSWAPAESRLRAGPGPSFAAALPSAAFVSLHQGSLAPRPRPTTTTALPTPPATSIALTPAVAVLPTTTSSTWRVVPPTTTSTTVRRRTVVTAPPTTRPPATVPPTTRPPSPASSETGQATWYVAPAGACASPTLPLGTVVTVTNLATGASATCTVEGRGPFGGGGRIMDLDEATFARLAPLAEGVIDVRVSW